MTSDSFWSGQERYDSKTGYVPRRFQGITKEWRVLGATNYEMENASIFIVSQALGLRAGSICGVMAKRTDSEAIAPANVYKAAEAAFQKTVREALLILTSK